MRHRPRVVVTLIAASGLAAASAFVVPAYAAPTSTIVATGLDNPRHLSIGAGSTVYVAESGTGGSGPCVPNPEDENSEVCLGNTGAVTEIDRRGQRRVVTGLPSLADDTRQGATGPTDVIVRGNNVSVTIGLGGNLETRANLGPDADALGTVVSGRLNRDLDIAIDVAAYEEANNPDGGLVDSNPGGFASVNSSRFAIVDSGGNSLVELGGNLNSRTVAAFPTQAATGPFGPMQAESVPTDVVQGPDGAYYVSELVGFPFPEGTARIWRVKPGQAPQVYATGLTHVTSLAWDHQTLYAVQFSDTSLMAGAPMGSLRKVNPGSGSHTVVLGNLFAPYGVAIHGNTAYVSVNSILLDAGEVHAVSLR